MTSWTSSECLNCVKVSVFGVILVRIQSECGKIWTRINPNTETFHVMLCTFNLRPVIQSCDASCGYPGGSKKICIKWADKNFWYKLLSTFWVNVLLYSLTYCPYHFVSKYHFKMSRSFFLNKVKIKIIGF